MMSDTIHVLGEVDRLCAQITFALHHSELQIYATLAVIAILSFLLFPPKNDPDQV